MQIQFGKLLFNPPRPGEKFHRQTRGIGNRLKANIKSNKGYRKSIERLEKLGYDVVIRATYKEQAPNATNPDRNPQVKVRIAVSPRNQKTTQGQLKWEDVTTKIFNCFPSKLNAESLLSSAIALSNNHIQETLARATNA